jgi:hypothetical protein
MDGVGKQKDTLTSENKQYLKLRKKYLRRQGILDGAQFQFDTARKLGLSKAMDGNNWLCQHHCSPSGPPSQHLHLIL